MPKTSPLRKPGARHKLPKFGVTRRLGRLVFTFGILAVFVAVLTVILIPKGSAQGNSDKHELAFARKADKMLHLVHKAKARDDAEQRSGLPARGKSRLEALSKTVGLQRKADGKVIIDVVVKLAGSSERELNEAGFAIGAKVGDMATLQVDLERLDDLASLSSVDKITAAVRRYPSNDRARKNVGIEDISAQRLVSQTGQGVIVAVIDTGIDFRHADFTVPGSGGQQTRIKALLDMTLYGAQVPDPGWNYVLPGQSAPIGHLYTEGDLNAALQLPKPANQSAAFSTEAQLEAARVAFVNDFMSRPVFTSTYNGLSNTQYVDALLASAGVTHAARDFWIASLGNGTRTRQQVLREIPESGEVYDRYYNQAFVVMVRAIVSR